MKYREIKKTGDKVSLMGVGAMRLPKNADGSVDRPHAIKMIRNAIDNGVNYIDTAYTYHGQTSESVVAEALRDGYREKVFIADKHPVWLANSEEEMKAIFYEQLECLETDCIDFYLIHNLTRGIWATAQKFNTFEFLTEMKKEGKIKYLGFSFHDDLECFKEIIDAKPWDFCQIQLNYMDKEFQAGVEGMKYAYERDIPVIIMEPVKGGRLASNIPPQIQELWDSAEVKRTPAEWALRWVANFPEVLTILNGVSNVEQMAENLNTFQTADANMLTDAELALIDKASEEYSRLIKYSCTGCGYCTPCPEGVDIPDMINFCNEIATYGMSEGLALSYTWVKPHHRATNCIGCQLCEDKCPQSLPIAQIMEEVKGHLG